jgi:hypothetical protein
MDARWEWQPHACPKHGVECFVKTGTSEGPNKGKSFFLCAQSCSHQSPAEVPALMCPLHAGNMVAVRRHAEANIIYRCKKSGDGWCGKIERAREVGALSSKARASPSPQKADSKPASQPSVVPVNPPSSIPATASSQSGINPDLLKEFSKMSLKTLESELEKVRTSSPTAISSLAGERASRSCFHAT